ncbi:MAG TPA: EAL domain-containing protein [Thermoleophilaceae bacterium]|nr:EAL domain-containing protein [Thermoleophilaceae bacterium]
MTPFETRGRSTIIAILLTFGLFSAGSVALSVYATSKSRHRAEVVQVAARQRTLADRYVQEVLLVMRGDKADPTYTGTILRRSAEVLLTGGKAPAVNGDDDEVELTPAKGDRVRDQLEQAQRLVNDLIATGSAVLAGDSVDDVRLTAHEHIEATDPVMRLRTLAGLTSNVSLNAVGTIATAADNAVSDLITTQVVLGIIGLLASLMLAWALIVTARRQSAQFRSLVNFSTDFVLVFGEGGCRYASKSLTDMIGRPADDVLGDGLREFVHPDDLPAVEAAAATGHHADLTIRVHNRFDEWRHLEAHVTDLRDERQVRGVVFNARDVTERVGLEAQLTRQAFHDALTDLANRALFRDRLDQALVRSGRSEEMLAVLLVDLDGFKQVNDSLGHDAGDELLRQVAARFSRLVRPSDTLARLGGDEFAILLDGAGEPQAVEVAERMIDSLDEPLPIADRALTLGASVGVVVHPGGAASSEDLLRDADIAMYAAKEAGRGRYEVFRYEMAREFGELLGLEQELRQALQRGEFVLHFQPEISLESSMTVGVEALVRWQSPTRGLVMPGDFIPVAETTGLILPLGEFALRAACEQTAEWLREGLLPDQFVTWVNLSGKQLSAGGVSTVVRRALKDSGLAPSMLGLEVTETAIVEGGATSERARMELEELHDLGVSIAVDDFGTGFSSLEQLRRFPIDVIKVDRSFVHGVDHDAKDAAIAANLVSLAHALGLVAIAEGIESEGQLRSLRGLDCDLAQGYLFAHPAPADQIGELLANGTGTTLTPTGRP